MAIWLLEVGGAAVVNRGTTSQRLVAILSIMMVNHTLTGGRTRRSIMMVNRRVTPALAWWSVVAGGRWPP